MRRLVLTFATTLFAFLLLAPPAWAEWVWPLRGEVITPYRNGGDPYASGQHRGIDIAGDTGAPVVAAAGGDVRFAGAAGSSGLTVSVRTADGRFDTTYLHLSSTAVREGDRVAAGDRIGAVGTSGVRSAATSHLHFGVRDAGSRHAYHDPLGFLPPPTGPQAPRGAPAPQPSPVHVAPAPAPVEAPAGRRVPVGAPNSRRVPVGAPNPRPVPVGAPSPRQVPVNAPNPGRVPVAAPNPRHFPVSEPRPRGVPVGAPTLRRVRAADPSSRVIPAGERSPSRVPAGSPSDHAGAAPSDRPPLVASSSGSPHPRAMSRNALSSNALPGNPGSPAADATNKRSPSGPDVGLMLACVGLVLAALLLGLTDDGRKATRKTGHGIARMLQPMLGRR
ncbi:MAG: peptidoglycan DD-metalloendopeptidase family protein [Thermoleophilaceae bacterium]